MKHLDILKQAVQITWRYRPLWIFGFLLALCGGSGGGGRANFSFPGGEEDFSRLEKIPNLSNIDPNTVIAVVVAVICLILLLVVAGTVIQFVARTALLGMVSQVKETQAVTVSDGWRWGWSSRAWRVFLVSLLIGLPMTIVAIVLILLALSPLLLLMVEEMALKVLGIILAVFAVLLVILLLIVLGAIIGPIQELAWRCTVLNQFGVVDSLRETIQLVKRRFKDVAIMWLLMLGIAIGWGIVALFVVLPVSLLAALIVGGIPAGLVYLMSHSGWGAAIAGLPLGVIVLILISCLAAGLYLVYQSAVWTLTYLELRPNLKNETWSGDTPGDQPGNDDAPDSEPGSDDAPGSQPGDDDASGEVSTGEP